MKGREKDIESVAENLSIQQFLTTDRCLLRKSYFRLFFYFVEKREKYGKKRLFSPFPLPTPFQHQIASKH